VRFVNEYVDAPTLQAWLSACDIYVTPYLSEAQITSGTLAYAVGLGKAVISTPYWHAQELLDGCRGHLVPFGSPEALAGSVGAVLSDRNLRDEMRRNAYQAGRDMIWPVVAERYTTLFSGRASRFSERRASCSSTPPSRSRRSQALAPWRG
jgi:glycosyltransferase involved in cell wall biosynthesis